jgi:transcriptional regulator with XRE-family HTH domain
MSQLDLAMEAEISSKHLSFVETGRAKPSRQMIQHLAEQLEIPLRAQNEILLAAGFAPAFQERSMEDPEMQAARAAVDLVLAAHEPYPALAVDRHWNLITANRPALAFLSNVDEKLRQPPINVLRTSLHPDGLAPRIINLREWRDHILHRLRQQIDVSAEPTLQNLYDELAGYPIPVSKAPPATDKYAGVVIPMQYATEVGTLSLFSTITVFGTPVDVTLSELAIEAFFPADAQTGEILRQIAAGLP